MKENSSSVFLCWVQSLRRLLDKLILLLIAVSVFANALGYSYASLAIIAATVLYLFGLAFLRNKICLPKPLWLVIGIYFAAQIICSVFAIYSHYSLLWSVKYIILYSLQFFLIAAMIKKRGWFYAILIAWVAGIAVADANVCWNYLVAGLGRKSVKGLLEISVVQLPDWLNCLVWPWLLTLAVVAGKRSRWLVAGAAILVISATIFNGGRNVWIAVIIETVLFLAVLRKYRFLGFALAAMAIIAVCMYQLPYIKTRMQLFTDGSARTNVNRLILWRYSLDMWRDFPAFGVGNGSTFQAVFNRFYTHGFFFTERVAHAHNVFLARLIETGIVGLMAFICYIGTFLQYFWSQYKKAPAENLWLLAGFLSIAGWLCMGLFDYSLHLTQVTRALWIVCALSIVSERLPGLRTGK